MLMISIREKHEMIEPVLHHTKTREPKQERHEEQKAIAATRTHKQKSNQKVEKMRTRESNKINGRKANQFSLSNAQIYMFYLGLSLWLLTSQFNPRWRKWRFRSSLLPASFVFLRLFFFSVFCLDFLLPSLSLLLFLCLLPHLSRLISFASLCFFALFFCSFLCVFFSFQNERDLAFENAVFRDPSSVKAWIQYIDIKRDAPAKVFALIPYFFLSNVFSFFVQTRNMIYERAVKMLPGSYKLWYRYLQERVKQMRNRLITDPGYEQVNNCFDRALVFLHKMPKIWMLYLQVCHPYLHSFMSSSLFFLRMRGYN